MAFETPEPFECPSEILTARRPVPPPQVISAHTLRLLYALYTLCLNNTLVWTLQAFAELAAAPDPEGDPKNIAGEEKVRNRDTTPDCCLRVSFHRHRHLLRHGVLPMVMHSRTKSLRR